MPQAVVATLSCGPCSDAIGSKKEAAACCGGFRGHAVDLGIPAAFNRLNRRNEK